jgi:hypothetical protein
MTTTRVTLITAAIVTGVLVVQGAIVGAWNIIFGYAAFGGSLGPLPNLFIQSTFWTLLTSLLHFVAFGTGVFIVIRYIAPIGAQDTWRNTVLHGIFAAVGGAIAAVIFDCIVSFIAAITIGAFPFGYSLNGAIDPSRIQYGFQNTVAASVTPLIEWLPLVLLACVFLKLWLVAHPATVGTKVRASAAAKP